jgi:undecaprenol kinase
LNRFVTAVRHAWNGFGHAVATQSNMRVHVVAAALVLGAAVWLRVSRESLIALVLAIALVFTFELANTALEAVVDLQSVQRHPLAKAAKDCAAAAVLVAAGAAVVVGVLVFFGR